MTPPSGCSTDDERLTIQWAVCGLARYGYRQGCDAVLDPWLVGLALQLCALPLYTTPPYCHLGPCHIAYRPRSGTRSAFSVFRPRNRVLRFPVAFNSAPVPGPVIEYPCSLHDVDPAVITRPQQSQVTSPALKKRHWSRRDVMAAKKADDDCETYCLALDRLEFGMQRRWNRSHIAAHKIYFKVAFSVQLSKAHN